MGDKETKKKKEIAATSSEGVNSMVMENRNANPFSRKRIPYACGKSHGSEKHHLDRFFNGSSMGLRRGRHSFTRRG